MREPRCDFCFFHCLIPDGQTGHCGIRRNQGGRIVTESWGQAVSLAIDPVEKKPLYHVQPGSQTLSVALFGCNLRCRFCQNAAISQIENRPAIRPTSLSPAELAEQMVELRLDSASFTYSEPTVWQDWMLAAASAVKQRHGHCFMVTNGSFSAEARQRFHGLIDAYNIDVKGDDGFYQAYCGGRLEPVLSNVRALCQDPTVAVEVCTLLIEGIHTVDGVVALGRQLAESGLKVWHLSRFFPAWKMQSTPPTSEAFLAEVLAAVRQQVDIPWCYGGNTSQIEDTCCPRCHQVLIERHHGRQGRLLTNGPSCPGCGAPFSLMSWEAKASG